MAEWTEVRRVENIDFNVHSYDTNCEVCGKPITLFYNGGELDQSECCGRRYRLEDTRIDFVVELNSSAPRQHEEPQDGR